MAIEKHTQFLNEYRKSFALWSDFADRLKNLLSELLKAKGIDFHIVEARPKGIDSVKEKLTRPGKNYDGPSIKFPDLCGARIVLYDQTGLAKTSSLIDEEFDVDSESSTNKSDNLAVDQFGYLSIHKIIKLASSRRSMTEWQRFGDMHAEIQIRTVLQHAWASVSHKIQYKRESEIPFSIRRRLVRLAGLFELADDEFLALRALDITVREEIDKKIEDNQNDIRLDLVSIESWVEKSPAVKEIEKIFQKHSEIVRVGNFGFDEDDSPPLGSSQLLQVATHLNLSTLTELEYALLEAKSKASRFWENMEEGMNGSVAHFLAVLLIAANRDSFAKASSIPFDAEGYIESIMKASEKAFG